jgi:hypothetical protein
MAAETTTTTLTELVYGEWISPFIQSYAANYQNPMQFLAKWNPTNGSSTVSVPKWVSDQGDVNDDGAAVDNEYAATEGSDLSNTELETTDSTFSISEFGLMREVTDTVLESNASGTTTANLTVADIDDALYDLAERGAQGELVGILDHQQIRDFQDALQATGTSMAVYAPSADRQIATSFDGKQGRNVEGHVLDYKGVPFYRNGLCDTANAAADVVGAIFVRGDIESQRNHAALGQGSLREFRVATERNESKRTTEVIMTMRWGCGITHNIMGQEVTTDAP